MTAVRTVVSAANRMTIAHSGQTSRYVLVLEDGTTAVTAREWEGDVEPCGWNNSVPVGIPVDLMFDERGEVYGFRRVDHRTYSIPTEPVRTRP